MTPKPRTPHRIANRQPRSHRYEPRRNSASIDLGGDANPSADPRTSFAPQFSLPWASRTHRQKRSPRKPPKGLHSPERFRTRLSLGISYRLRLRTYQNPDTTPQKLRRRPSIRASQNQPRKSTQLRTLRNKSQCALLHERNTIRLPHAQAQTRHTQSLGPRLPPPTPACLAYPRLLPHLSMAPQEQEERQASHRITPGINDSRPYWAPSTATAM